MQGKTKSSDENNIILATSSRLVDNLNASFYTRFQYPWAPMTFDCVDDPYFETILLNQSLGDWNQTTLPREPRIWVAGCGANQAVFTALRFPHGLVIGSDLSVNSLETAARAASDTGVSNLELRRESINDVAYRDEFDYILCTGVIHHNANPKESMEKLAQALKSTGILEVMVYNRFHRITTTAFQKAIRAFRDPEAEMAFELELHLTRSIIDSFSMNNSMGKFLEEIGKTSESQLADSLLQPVEYSYTVESLEQLADACGLEYVAPCVTQFDKIAGSFHWNLEFADPELQQEYESLPDSRRWQISNHLMLEQSPLLWFYLQRKDAGRMRKSEQQMCHEFLDQKFIQSSVRKKTFVKAADGTYKLSQRLMPYPGHHSDRLCEQIIAAVAAEPSKRLRELLRQLEIEEKFALVNKLRLSLTTNAFPFLVAAL